MEWGVYSVLFHVETLKDKVPDIEDLLMWLEIVIHGTLPTLALEMKHFQNQAIASWKEKADMGKPECFNNEHFDLF